MAPFVPLPPMDRVAIKLHDCYFLFVNGMAVVYALVTREQGNRIWNKLLAKMKGVGYDRFEFGLPGSLIPVRREDYVDHDIQFGGPTRPMDPTDSRSTKTTAPAHVMRISRLALSGN